MNTPHAVSAARALSCDVLVIGGGPAGPATAALLAERGCRVDLLEKLGMADAIKAIGMEKWGAEFVSPWHDRKQVLEFADAVDKSTPMSYQVRRAVFGKTPIHDPLPLFKGLYYAASLPISGAH